jgi:uncharacterized membrane-anchored protein
MRKMVFIAASLVILCAFNWNIYEKEQLKQTGETVLLELAPVDPRSLMQGDYMRLNYKITTQMKAADGPERGYAVITTDKDGVGSFSRLDDGTPLKDGEKLLRFHRKYSSYRIVPDSFMFQEGLRDVYRPAKYGVFKFDRDGGHILTGLADDKMHVIEPSSANIPSLP